MSPEWLRKGHVSVVIVSTLVVCCYHVLFNLSTLLQVPHDDEADDRIRGHDPHSHCRSLHLHELDGH